MEWCPRDGYGEVVSAYVTEHPWRLSRDPEEEGPKEKSFEIQERPSPYPQA
jgi:hypothetical protein